MNQEIIFHAENFEKYVALVKKFPKAYALLLFLAKNMENYQYSDSIWNISEAIGVSNTTIENSIKALKELKFLTVETKNGKNLYIINSDYIEVRR